MKKDVIVIGTGGHAKVVADIVLRSADKLCGFLTSDPEKSMFLGKPVLGKDTDWEKLSEYWFIIAIGDPTARERIAGRMTGARWYTAIHPSAVVSPLDVSIGEGTVVAANAVVNPGAHIGRHCIVNSSATVEHDNFIDDFAHISVGAKLAGTVRVGKRTWVGAGAAVRDGIGICQDCVVGAGAAVVKNIDVPGIYAGVPARMLQAGRNGNVL